MYSQPQAVAMYLLRPLQEVIQIEIPNAVKINYPLNPDVEQILTSRVDQEVETIKELLPAVDLVLKNSALKDYIRRHQYDTIELIASLAYHSIPLEYQQDGALRQPSYSFAGRILHRLENILLMLEQTYPKQFNPNARLPAGYRRLASAELKGKLQDLTAAITGYEDAEALWYLAADPVRQFVDDPRLPDLDYSQLAYYRRLLSGISKLTSSAAPVPTKEFHRLLHRYNFNSSEYIQYCIDQMERDLALPDLSPEAKLAKISQFQKTVTQFRPIVKQALDRNAISVTKYLTNWLKAELQAIENHKILATISRHTKVEHPARETAVQDALSMQGDTDEDDGVRLNMTVPQTAFGMKILRKIDIIAEKNMTKVGSRIASSIKTVGSVKPSHHSLMNNYYEKNPHHDTYAFALSAGQKIVTYVLQNMPPEEISKNLFEEEFIQTVSKHIALRPR